MNRFSARSVAALALVVAGIAPVSLVAQGHDHAAHGAGMMAASEGAVPSESGQGAFAALAEIVAILEADPATDWTRVDLDALREHLRDMDRVILHAEVSAEAVEGGVALEVTGEGEIRDAIRRMLFPHAGALEQDMAVEATPAHHDRGLVLTVVARDPSDTELVTRIRALGFAGLMARGGHHQPHHLAIARGEITAGAHEHH